jgi:hypothetical protein
VNQENPAYYAIITAHVRYDKNITANAKLLFGEISALCNQKGECWAKNKYFAELYGVSEVSISKWIKQLSDNGHITVRYEYVDGGKQILRRWLRIVNDPLKEKLTTPPQEKFKDNITSSINITSNNKKDKKENDFDLFWKAYPRKVDKKKSKSAYLRATSLPGIQDHIEILKRWTNTKQWREGFIPYPTTWLNGERWEDALPVEPYDWSSFEGEDKSMLHRWSMENHRDPISNNEAIKILEKMKS